MLKALWQKVAGKASSTSRALGRSSKFPKELGKSTKEKLDSSQQTKIYETSASAAGIATLLSNEKSRLSRVLNEYLRIPHRLLGSRVILNIMTLHRNSMMIGNDIRNLLFFRRDIVERITTRLKCWKSSQSSCKKNNYAKKFRRCIENHQQAMKSCGKTVGRCSDDHQIAVKSRQSSCGDLLGHQEYYQSIESGCPIYLHKPAQYNDQRACDSTAWDSHKCLQSEVDDADVGRVISSKCWTSGKPATEGEIHRQCRPKTCSSPYRSNREEEKCSPSCTVSDCSKEETNDMKGDELNLATVDVSQQCPKFESSEKLDTSIEKETLCAEEKMSNEDQTKSDTPPSKQQHWPENPPVNCEHSAEKTCKSTVESSPMMFVPYKGPRKSRAKNAESSCSKNSRDRSECETDTKAKITCAKSLSQKSPARKCVLFEDKSVDSLILPAASSATKPKRQEFLTLTESDGCCAKKCEKEFVTSDIRDCKSNKASLKCRLSKCSSRVKETCKIADHDYIDVCEARRRRRAASICTEKMKKPRICPETTRRKKGKGIESRNRWTRRRSKVHSRIFQKRSGQLDSCLSPIDEQTRSSPSKLLKSAAREGELSPRSGSPSQSDYCPSKRPIVEHKSYPTKMDECRRQINDDWYHMEHRSVAKRSTEPHLEVHDRLMKDSRVRRAEQQRAKSRTKRDLIVKRPSNLLTMMNDERWPQMWYLNRGKGLDMNVQGAWSEGITGSGIVVTILDDGLEKDHPDLYKNYDPQASYDVNSHDEDPMPRYDLVDSNRHGTRCAGEVAATANNSICAVGVAFGAGVGGVRMLDGDVTDAVEARSLSLNPQHIDIYSASWGPDDDGKTVDGPGELATRAFIEGITKGRSGKGSIFVWASGNGGRDHDNCNCDGYTNSIWTLSISSATENGLVPWYSEACSSTLATTYSSGATGEKQVVTTDLHHHCTSSHTGTSASAPLAAGICALALEANKDLTWRDMQHIVVRTAKPANLQASDWVVNGVGRNVSHSFGYGLMDATAMVRLAKRWRTVPEQHKCEVSAPHTGRPIPPKSQLILDLHVKECSGVNFLEHVQAKVSLMATRRGDLQIQLTSPQGTKSTLLAKRPHDVSKAGFSQWPFMSVHTWGERPHGTWRLEIHNEGRYLGRATLHEWALIFYGTSTLPDRTEYALYNPAGMSMPRRPFVKPRETSFSKSQNALAKGKQAQHKSDKSGNLSPPYVVNAQIQSQRKGKARGQHKNGKSASRPNPKPTAQTLRGLTGLNNKSPGDVRLITSRPRGRSTPSPITSTATQVIATTKTQTTATCKHRIVDLVTASPLQRGLILLEPPAKEATNKVPAVFQQYPKIQQLYPVYGGARGVGQQHATRAKGLDLLQDEQFDSGNIDKDTLEEWRLVFFGTETSVELDDELDKDKPQPAVHHQNRVQDNTASDRRQNAVDTEGDPWTGSQQVERVSHPEVQRPTTENQRNGCATFEATGGRCLGGCLILLLLAYLTGSVPGWQELITSWPASTDSRSEPGVAEPKRLIATGVSTTTTTTATATTSSAADATTRHVSALDSSPVACGCS